MSQYLGTFMFWGPFRETAHTQESSCQKKMLSWFTMHRESQGPVTSTKSHCSSPRSMRSKTTVSENAATLPKLSPQLQMLQTGCTDIPAQRNMSFITHFWSPLCHLPGSATSPPHPTAQPWRCSYIEGIEKTHLFFLSPHLLCHNSPVTHLWYIASTANSHCYF